MEKHARHLSHLFAIVTLHWSSVSGQLWSGSRPSSPGLVSLKLTFLIPVSSWKFSMKNLKSHYFLSYHFITRNQIHTPILKPKKSLTWYLNFIERRVRQQSGRQRNVVSRKRRERRKRHHFCVMRKRLEHMKSFHWYLVLLYCSCITSLVYRHFLLIDSPETVGHKNTFLETWGVWSSSTLCHLAKARGCEASERGRVWLTVLRGGH